MAKKKDGRGGARTGTGPKPIPEEEKKVGLSFYFRPGLVGYAKEALKPIVAAVNGGEKIKAVEYTTGE